MRTAGRAAFWTLSGAALGASCAGLVYGFIDIAVAIGTRR